MTLNINEQTEIRRMLGIVRQIQESSDYNEVNPIQNDTTPESGYSDKSGEKIVFSKINTRGFLKTKLDFTDEEKASFAYGIEQILATSGLIVSVVTINAEDGRVIITSDSVRNPELRDVKFIKIDTDNTSVEVGLTTNSLMLSDELTKLLSSITTTYNDPQNGRDNLIKLTQQTLQL